MLTQAKLSKMMRSDRSLDHSPEKVLKNQILRIDPNFVIARISKINLINS